ncbi:hypothetical protein [Streptomyces sp. NPDC014744]|uniref:hypothetical protein n=1 Tax=Streptomyces sp. NPDC014744 TaxID=3364903 RepID=UPI0036FD8247
MDIVDEVLLCLGEAAHERFLAVGGALAATYANDLGDPRSLIAVSAASNRSKADQDPSTWQPPAAGYRCQYVMDWIADKTRSGLSIDPAERTALVNLLEACPNAPLTVTRALTPPGASPGPRAGRTGGQYGLADVAAAGHEDRLRQRMRRCGQSR